MEKMDPKSFRGAKLIRSSKFLFHPSFQAFDATKFSPRLSILLPKVQRQTQDPTYVHVQTMVPILMVYSFPLPAFSKNPYLIEHLSFSRSNLYIRQPTRSSTSRSKELRGSKVDSEEQPAFTESCLHTCEALCLI